MPRKKHPTSHAWVLSTGVHIDPKNLRLAILDMLSQRAQSITERVEKDKAIADLRDTALGFMRPG